MRIVIDVASGSFALVVGVGDVQNAEYNSRHTECNVNTNGFKWCENDERKDDRRYAAGCSEGIIPWLFPVFEIGGQIGNNDCKQVQRDVIELTGVAEYG